MRAGTRVQVMAQWSTLHGQHGTIVAERPVMVRLDDDPRPLHIGAVSLVTLEPPEPPMASGE